MSFVPLIVLIVALVEAFLAYKVVRNGRPARLLASLPLSRIGELQAGLAKVEGRAVAIEGTFRSPLADRKCVYFHFQVQEKRRRHAGPHGGGTYWKTVIDDAQALSCALDDGTGSADLHLDTAELVLNPDEDERSGFLNSARPELAETLQELYGYSTVGLIFNKTLYYSETRIEPGDTLVALGTARETPEGNWELAPGNGLLLVSNMSLVELRASYRNAAILWSCLAALLVVAAGAALVALS